MELSLGFLRSKYAFKGKVFHFVPHAFDSAFRYAMRRFERTIYANEHDGDAEFVGNFDIGLGVDSFDVCVVHDDVVSSSQKV